MERFTRKVNEEDLPMGFGGDNYRFTDEYIFGENPNSPTDKLGQLEDIEEELGIDLITLFKALKEGIYCIDFDNQDIRKFKAPLCFNSTSKQFYWYGSNIGYPDLKDYGKTWALTKEELENGR